MKDMRIADLKESAKTWMNHADSAIKSNQSARM